MNSDQLKGRIEQAKGKVKEATGKVVGSEKLKTEGRVDQVTGKTQASYGDAKEDGEGYEGFDNDFTRRNTTFMTWNLMHMARMLKDAGGIPAWGNSVDLWQEGRRFDAPNPEYR